MNVNELKEKRGVLVGEKNDFLDKAEALDKLTKDEKRSLSEKEEKDSKNWLEEASKRNDKIKELDEEIRLAEKVEQMRAERAESENKKRVKIDQRNGETKDMDEVLNNFSVTKAMRNLFKGKVNEGAEAEIEKEGANEYRSLNMEPQGFVIPRSALDRVEKRTDIDQNTAGIQGTELDGYVRAIRENAVYNKVGIRFRRAVGDQKTNIITAMNWAWVAAENTAATDIGANPTSVTASPKWGRGYVDVSKTLLAQNPEAMGEFMFDLGVAEANFFDGAFFASSSVSNAPTAIAATSNVLTFEEAGSYAANSSVYGDFVEAVQTMGVNNVVSNGIKFVANAYLFSDLYRAAQVASVTEGMGSPGFVGSRVAGYPTIFTNHTGSATGTADVIAGDFAMGVKAYQWGGLDLFLDPYSVSLTDQVRIVGHKRVSWVVPQGEKFVKFTSLTA